MAKTVFDVLKDKIDGDISSAQSFLTAGSPKDYAEFREVVGLIRGLEASKLTLKTLRKTIWKTMMTEAAVKISDAELELQLPKPVGYRVLVALPQPEETISGTSIMKTDTAKTQDHIMSIIGLVVDMGDQAYSDDRTFPDRTLV